MIKNTALFFSATDEKTLYKHILQYETVRNNEVCVLSGCPYSGVFHYDHHKKKKQQQPKNRVLLGALLFGCVVSFVVCNLRLNNYRRNHKTGFDCITEVKNQNLSQVHPSHHTQGVLLISSRCQTSKISYSHVQDSQVTTLWSFLVVRNCFENLSWYFLVKQETLAPVTSHPLMFKLL